MSAETWRRGTRVAALSVAAALSVMLQIGPARAAVGIFFYYTHPGRVPWELANPQDHQCYTVGDADGYTQNHTDRYALLYMGSECRGQIWHTLYPHTAADLLKFKSVRFVPHESQLLGQRSAVPLDTAGKSHTLSTALPREPNP
ncbi:hypothetical protein ACFYY8_24805 [Streptosporangium sp. NPDC001559]|uniref:hypothetical protein n=1 Tax=Streptosporangium sp. NPDC001559 TaxID=3366187 RepID=UPI0036E91BCA